MSSTQSKFDSEAATFTRICKKECPELLQYFQKNWKTCVTMWTNHARGKFFSAGNSTTNRIESNWNQLKLLLGKRPRIDFTISGLLAHQANIIRHQISAIRKHFTKSPQLDTVPEILVHVAKRLSDNMLAKVRSQWEYFMVTMSEMTCMKQESGVGEYAVSAQGHAYECNDFLWSCSCLFYCSYNLPCQHLMYIAARIHKFESMPVSSIPPRRDMTEMGSMEEDFLRGVLSIQAVQEIMKIAGDSYGHDGLTQPTDGDDAFEAPDEALVQVKAKQAKQKATLKATQSCISVGKMVKYRHIKRRIIYMKMRRRERANLPVVEHLAGLSSPSFYAALKSWREIVNKGMKQVGFMPVNVMVPPDGSDHETTSDIAPADLIDSMNMICELKKEKVAQSRYCHLAADASAKIGKEECQETIKEKVAGDEKSYPVKISLTERHLTDVPDESKGSCKSTSVARAHGQVEVIRFPRPKARHNRRKKAKQTLLKSSLKPRKLAAMSLPDKQVPSLSRVLEWANHTTDRFHVSELLNNYPVIMEDDFMGSRTARCERGYVFTDDYDFNYVIPKSLVTKLEA
ncbi:Hypothetical protein PHPALM_13081, partial [Phytophthora palmivora]